MIIENHALWGEEPTEDYPATFTYLGAEPLPDKPNGRRPAVIICGGGGFTHIAPHEQDPVAFAFLDRGYQAFVLNYVTSATGDVSFPHPQADRAKMVATVRANADEWHVDPKRVCIVGFSAGGMICASLATQWKTGPFAGLAGARPEDIRPDAVVLGYPLLDLAYVRDMQTRDPRIDLRVPKTGGKTGRDLLNDYLSMVTGGEATDEHLADICPTTHVSRQMPPTFVWGVRTTRRRRSRRSTRLRSAWPRRVLHARCTSLTRVATAFRSATPIPRSTTRTSRFPSVPGSAWPSASWNAICKSRLLARFKKSA